MGVKGLVSLIREDILLFFSVPGFAWEIDGTPLNATETYFASVVMGVFRQIGTIDKNVYISGRSLVLPRVYGRMQTEIFSCLVCIINYTKSIPVIQSQVQVSSKFKNLLRKNGSNLTFIFNQVGRLVRLDTLEASQFA